MTRNPATLRHAFSLVEVLVAVLVLALGLLGLGAVFPMVVRQQRIATETTLGVSARNAVQQILNNNQNFGPGGRGWPALRQYVIDNAGDPGDWVPVVPDRTTSDYIIPAGPDDPNTDDVVLPLSQRLYPLPFSTEADPRFVWDMAARLVDHTDPDGPILVAVFIRPIDPAIRPAVRAVNGEAEPYSIIATLLGVPGTNEPAIKDRRFPLSVDNKGRPTLDGRRDRGSVYSRPSVLVLKSPHGSGAFAGDEWRSVAEPVAGDVIPQNQDGARLAEQLLARQNQRFVDRAGNLYTITGWAAEANRGINFRISPDITGLTDANGDGAVNPLDLNPVIFVPQATTIEPLIFTVQP